MTLTDAKMLLEKRRIPYQTAQYESEAAYWRHCLKYPYLDNVRNCPVIALVIPAINGVKNIELQFNRRKGEYEFRELWFGGYSFELLYEEPELAAASVLDYVGQIVDGKLAFVGAIDNKRKRILGNSCFDMTENDTVFGAPGYREAIAKIEKPKTFWQKLTGQKLQYDIYDWRTYRQVIK